MAAVTGSETASKADEGRRGRADATRAITTSAAKMAVEETAPLEAPSNEAAETKEEESPASADEV